MKLLIFSMLFCFSHYAMAQNAQAVNCGEPADHFMMEALTKAPEQGGLSGSIQEVGQMAQDFVSGRGFGNLVGKKAIVLKPYRIAAILKSEGAICAIYTGQVVNAKVLTEDDINNY